MNKKQPKPVRAWAVLIDGKIDRDCLTDTFKGAKFVAKDLDPAEIVRVEIRPIPKAKARKK